MRLFVRCHSGHHYFYDVIDCWLVHDSNGFCGLGFSLGDLEPDHYIPLCDLAAVRLLPDFFDCGQRCAACPKRDECNGRTMGGEQ